MGGKLIKFRGHEGINENHESFYPRKFLAVRYLYEKNMNLICTLLYLLFKCSVMHTHTSEIVSDNVPRLY